MISCSSFPLFLSSLESLSILFLPLLQIRPNVALIIKKKTRANLCTIWDFFSCNRHSISKPYILSIIRARRRALDNCWGCEEEFFLKLDPRKAKAGGSHQPRNTLTGHTGGEREQLGWCLESSLWRTKACRVKAWHLGENRDLSLSYQRNFILISFLRLLVSLLFPSHFSKEFFLFHWNHFTYVGYSYFPAVLHLCMWMNIHTVHQFTTYLEFLLLARLHTGHY